jgi:hypothetical protein
LAVVITVCMLATPGVTSGKQNGKPTIGDPLWTVAVYVCADNDLEPYWEATSLAMLLNIPESDGVEFVAYVDLMSTEETRIMTINGGETALVESLPEMNFGEGATFEWFLEDVDARFEPENLAVIAWDHGSAWRGFCYDYTSGDRITPAEMRGAIIGAGVTIDILAFDATLGVIDVSVISDSIATIDKWTKEMLEGLPEHLMDYRFALRDACRVSCVAHYQVDIVDLGRQLLASPSVAEDAELAEATMNLMDCVEQAVLYVYNPERKADSAGLSIYWGFNNEQWRFNWDMYTSEVSFAVDTSWDEFLIQYNLLTAGWYAAELVLGMVGS